MSTRVPLVSVVMPVFNGGAYLWEAIRSILEQTFSDFELIIVDDGSTDQSRDIVRSFADDRIRLVPEKHLGLVHALNHGLREARGEYVARMDSDDISLPSRFSEQVEFLKRQTEVVAVSSNVKLIDHQGEQIGKATAYDRWNMNLRGALLRSSNPIVHSTVMFRRPVVLDLGGYDPFFVKAQDYELWLRLSQRHPLFCLPRVLVSLRRHGSNLSLGDQQPIYILTALVLHKAYLQSGCQPDEACKAGCLKLCEHFYETQLKRRRQGLAELKPLVKKLSWRLASLNAVRALCYRMRNPSCVLESEVERLVRLHMKRSQFVPTS